MLHICENIKQARLSSKKTQGEMADLLGVKRSTYANWEATTEPDMSTLRTIAQVLDIKISDLINEKDEENNNLSENHTPYFKVKPTTSVDALIESNRLLAESQKIFAESQRIFAQSQLNFSENHRKVIDTNSVLTEMISHGSSTPGLQGVPVAALTRLSGLLEYVAEIGVSVGKWASKDVATSELNKRFYGHDTVGEAKGTVGA